MVARPEFLDHASERDKSRWVNVLANLPLFDRAQSSTIETLISHAVFRCHPPGERIYVEGAVAEHAFFLVDGVVRVIQGHGRAEYTPKLFRAPAHFGDLANLSGLGRYQSTIEAATCAVSARVPYRVLLEALESDHKLCLAWLRSVARQHAVSIDADRQNVFGGLRARLANVLLSYGDVFGVPADALQAIDFPLSYQQLSQQVGGTRRAMISIMKQLSTMRVVKSVSSRWLIDRVRLTEVLIAGRQSLGYSLQTEAD